METFHYSLSEIALIIKAEIDGFVTNNDVITDILIDSRLYSGNNNSLFIAIKNKHNDGHKYIKELYEKGLRYFLVSSLPKNKEKFKNAIFIVAKDTVASLQQLAAYHRKQFSLPVIGITGSNGKTIIKEWLYQLISPDKNIVRSPKSYNSQIGVPISVLQINTDHNMALFEAGISEPDEMLNLEKIIKPDIGIYTNIGSAHEENFINIQQKIAEKLKLFLHSKLLIYCSDFAEIRERIAFLEAFREKTFFTWSRKHSADLFIIQSSIGDNSTIITALYKQEEIQIEIPFTDYASIENAIFCWATMLYLGYDNAIIRNRIKELIAVEMRLCFKHGINNCVIIDDAYSFDFDSLKIALEFLSRQGKNRSLTVILSDMLQSNKNEFELYSEIAQLLKQKQVTKLVGIGKIISKHSDAFDLEKLFYPSTEDFLSKASFHSFNEEAILLKGARLFHFEKISNALQQKAHETILEVNLSAMLSNFNYYKSLVKPDTKIMLMVKAFSYGTGSYEIANLLQFHHANYLAVAYTDEGVDLRSAGITLPLMVMNPEEASIDALIKYNLEPEIYSFRILDLIEQAQENYFSSVDYVLPVHLKFDTGMHRLGFDIDDTEKLIERIKSNPKLKIASVLSHIAASDNPEHDEFTRHQADLLKSIYNIVSSKIDYPILLHTLNSSGRVRFPEFQFDMVRLGLGLYGISDREEERKYLKNVCTFKTRISQIKHIPAGETIGYNRMWTLNNNTKVAVLPVGYADGLNRHLSNGKGKVWIKGNFVPIIGNICMDMCMVDIGDFDIGINDEAIIFGEAIPITEVAEQLGTIPYEILTNISQRVKRIYFQE